MATPLSGASAYCTAAQLVQRYDTRTVGDLLSDSGTRLTAAQVLSSTVLAALLKQASGMLESACLVGKRYTPDDLAALEGNSAELAAGLVADLAIWLLYNRRPERRKEMPGQVEVAFEFLDKIRSGERIFGFVEHAESATTQANVETSEDVEGRNGLAVQADRFFGTRSNRRDRL